MVSPKGRAGGVELAQIVHAHGAALVASRPLAAIQQRALRAIAACRTAALGGHRERCEACGAERYRYHSCRNRHCPKCQTLAKERWLAARRAELLPVPYFHIVFTLPHGLSALAQGNARAIYGMLLSSAADTLLEFGRNPRWLGGEIALTTVLHTWGQRLDQHLHVHCLVSAGALTDDGRWIRPKFGFLFPVKALSKVFRGKILAALTRAFEDGRLRLAGSTAALAGLPARRAWFAALAATDWVVYAKRPFGGPEQVLQYLGRYTHRVAIANERLIDFDEQAVRFRYKDYAHGAKRRVMALDPVEFLRRFALHVLPPGFQRIRHYGLAANRGKRERLARAREALGDPASPAQPPAPESPRAFWLRVTGHDIEGCPECRTVRMRVVAILAPLPRPRAPP